MKDLTKIIRNEYYKDHRLMLRHNNSKFMKRTPEQNAQSVRDKKTYYSNKWSEVLKTVTTKAQKQYCIMALDLVSKIR